MSGILFGVKRESTERRGKGGTRRDSGFKMISLAALLGIGCGGLTEKQRN